MLFAVAFTASAGANAKARDHIPPPDPARYACVEQLKDGLGDFRFTRYVDGDGKLVRYDASFRTNRNDPDSGLRRFGGGWFGKGGEEFQAERGSFYVDLDMGATSSQRALKGKRFSVELSTNSDPLVFVGHISSKRARFSEFAHSFPDLDADWSDVAAMAKGSERIFILARDRENHVLFSMPVDSSLINSVGSTIHNLSEQTRERAMHFSDRCEPYNADDLAEIIVT
jgi:hypothetical protein